MLKYVFMGTPPIAKSVLEALCQEGYRPQLVISQTAKIAGRGQKIQPSAVEQFASHENLALITTDDVNTDPALSHIQSIQPDLILVVAFGQILRDAILTLPKIACLNVHASLLPHLRGAAPVQRAIWEGDTHSGITIQKMAKKLDTGDILLQNSLGILPKETSGELMARLAILGGTSLVSALKLIESGEYSFTPQNEALATYAKKLDKSDSKIDWEKTASEIERQIRALQPWPTAEITIGENKLKIFLAQVVDGKMRAAPGSIDTDSKSYLNISCGKNTTLSLLEVQPENRKRMGIKDYLLGFRGHFPHTLVS